MPDDPGKSYLEWLPGAVKALGFGGLAGALWTTVVCTALYKADAKVTIELWPDLYWTWVILVGLWLLFYIISLAAEKIVRDKENIHPECDAETDSTEDDVEPPTPTTTP
ncbi:MAG: hypothetical protein NUW37_11525 [Planctomycetes bacterium]|nr:hypothetical protein [Planctomycetota bacterium]